MAKQTQSKPASAKNDTKAADDPPAAKDAKADKPETERSIDDPSVLDNIFVSDREIGNMFAEGQVTVAQKHAMDRLRQHHGALAQSIVAACPDNQARKRAIEQVRMAYAAACWSIVDPR